MVTIREFAKRLDNVKEELKDKELFVCSKNGMLMPVSIHFKTDCGVFSLTKETVEYAIIEPEN